MAEENIQPFLDPAGEWFWVWRFNTLVTVYDPDSHRSAFLTFGDTVTERRWVRRAESGNFSYELVRRAADWNDATAKWVRRRPPSRLRPWPPYHKADPFTRDLLAPEKVANRPVSWRVLELLDRMDILGEKGFNESERSHMSKARAEALALVDKFKLRVRQQLADEENWGTAEDDMF